MKIAWVSTYDAADPAAYGGRGYYAPRALRNQSISVDYIGPLPTPLILRLYRKLFVARARLLYDNPFIKPSERRWYSRDNAPFVFKNYAREISRRLARLTHVDIVCSGVGPTPQPVAYLDCKQPIVVWTDTTFASAFDFYPQYFRNRICPESIRDITANEATLMDRCRLAIFASEWGAQSALDHYRVNPSTVKVVPFGANLEGDRDLEAVRQAVNSRPSNECRLLFIGGDWFRKGGDVAFEVAKGLNANGLLTELTVVGCDPILHEPPPSYVRSLGYISNASIQGQHQLSKVFAESHFLIMPSRAESFGHVFCEASSFGVPSIASNVGGIPTAVRTGVNGRTFSTNSTIAEYCSYISDLFSNYSRYKDLALSSFNEYESRLNWSVAGRSVKKLLIEVIS
jgi:glycosyltransferase involved in cell wall biosynthesis